MKVRLDELNKQADAMCVMGEQLAALRLYCEILQLAPKAGSVRLAIADCLAACGERAAAAEVYAAVSDFCIDGGWPLLAVVALRALEAGGADIEERLQRLALAYEKGSNRVGQVGGRTNARLDTLNVDDRILKKKQRVEELYARAREVGSDLSAAGPLPTTFPPAPILGELSAETLKDAYRSLKVLRFPHQHRIFAAGDPSDSCYLVANGAVHIYAEDETGNERKLAELASGNIFGEMGVVTGARRSASATVVKAADVLQFGTAALGAMGDELPRLAPTLDKLAQGRQLNNLLEQSVMFRSFDKKQRQDLLKRFTAYDVAPKTVIFDAGQHSKGIFLILRGEVSLCWQDTDPEHAAEHVASGFMLGVNSVINAQPARATATTMTQSTLLFLSGKAVLRLADAFPQFKKLLEEVASRRGK
jgi:CRP-like cAMP-binding protein